MPTEKRVTYLSAAFYGLLSFLLIAILFEFVTSIVPVGAGQVSHNSEAYAAIIILGLWIQLARPRLHGSRWEWPVTAGAAVLCLIVALVLFMHEGEWPSRWVTLNETLFGLAVVIPYVQPRRRRPALGVALFTVTLAVMVFGGSTELVTDWAENLAIVALAALAFDVFDRGILDPDAPDDRARRYGWYVLLLIAPLTLRFLQYDLGVEGWFGDVTRYGVRFYEAFIFLLVLELFFVFGLGRVGRRAGEPLNGAPRGETTMTGGPA